MHEWGTRMLLKHYLDQGLTKAELSRRFGVSRRTIHYWIESGQMDRDLATSQTRYSPRPAVASQLDPYGTTGERPVDRFERDERGALHSLADRPYQRLGAKPQVGTTLRRLSHAPVEVERRPLSVYAEAVR